MVNIFRLAPSCPYVRISKGTTYVLNNVVEDTLYDDATIHELGFAQGLCPLSAPYRFVFKHLELEMVFDLLSKLIAMYIPDLSQ